MKVCGGPMLFWTPMTWTKAAEKFFKMPYFVFQAGLKQHKDE